MSNMETDAPISITDCTERLRICAKIEGHDIVANNYEGLDNLPDTAENQEMEIFRAALEETLRKKADLVSQKTGLPLPINKTFTSNVCTEGVSFANIVSGVTSPTPTPSDNLNEKPSKIENNSKESQGILSEDDNSNDLAQAIELVNLIFNILKKISKNITPTQT
ncbi:hypothetical protein TNCV_2197851 [Trichonephila clavipes]|nr:hypothetical protein TNCV_2197851 [Trichonephila clavipes]